MFDFLERFQNRMEFSAVIDSIVNRRNKNTEIESWFEPFEIDNLLFSVLVFIMESTLTEDKECTLSEINTFLKEILQYYKKDFSLNQIEELSRYLIKDILRNNGRKRSYEVMNYEIGSMDEVSVMLVEDYMIGDKDVGYRLTSQGYNFLFRTKEIDDELGFKMEEFRLKLLITKKNYKKAVSQSRELIQILRNKENQLLLFEKRLRNNIKQVSSDEYTGMINDIYQLLEQEYDIMQEIQEMITLAKERLIEEENNYGGLDEKAVNAKREITIIENNVETALNYQRRLIVQCKKTKDIYVEMLRDAIRYMHKKTYNFDKIILNPLESGGVNNTDILDKLLLPLMKIQFKKSLNLSSVYTYQSISEDLEGTDIFEEPEFEDDFENIQKELRSSNYVRLIDELLYFGAKKMQKFTLKDFIGYLYEKEACQQLLTDKNTYIAFLKLYEFGEINISEWKENQDEISSEPTGEFDLSYCLFKLSLTNKNFYNTESISIRKTDEFVTVNSTILKDFPEFGMSINNIDFEVKLLEKSTENI